MKNPVEIIIKKRSGGKLTEAEIKAMVNGYVAEKVPDYQMSAFLMAIFFAGMDDEETYFLTKCYIDSGVNLSFDANTVDKHSTGGVGDKVSIVLAPIVAACGGKIPMFSGRGLGHTGGTLDKLEAIPNFSTDLDEESFRRIIGDCGFSIASQSKQMVPADKKIYALRDVTGTVESFPLITASIMSKKIAEGAKNLVIDLKVGTGAFMKTLVDAKELGRRLKKVGEAFGQKVRIVYTCMNNPIGAYIGNGLEIKECIEYLQGEFYPDLHVINKALAVQMLMLSDLARDEAEAGKMVERVIADGSALKCLGRFIELQGGDARVTENTDLLPQAEVEVPIVADRSGYVQGINSQAIGYALIALGAGRRELTDKLDYGTGAKLLVKIGDEVSEKQNLGVVYCRDERLGVEVARKIVEAIDVGDKSVPKENLILDIE